MVKGFYTVALALIFTFAANSQTLDEVIQKNIEARGGVENWQAVKSLKMEGTYTSFSTPHPFTIHRKRPGFYRFEHFLSSKPVTCTFDGESAWWINPWYGETDATSIPAPDSLVTLREKEFDNVFWNYREKDIAVELLEKGDVDGQECYKLKVTHQNNVEETWYIDSASFLEIKMEGETYDFGRKVNLVMYFDDFRETGGVLMPYYVEQEFGTRHRVFEINAITTNPNIEDSIFTMPVTQAAPKDAENQ